MNPLAPGAGIDVNNTVAVAADAADAWRRPCRGEDPAFRHPRHADIRRLTKSVQRAGTMSTWAVARRHQRASSGAGCNVRQYASQSRREAVGHDGSSLDGIGRRHAVVGKPDLAPLAIPGFGAGEKGKGQQAGKSNRENVTHCNPPWQMPHGTLISDAACKRHRPAGVLGTAVERAPLKDGACGRSSKIIQNKAKLWNAILCRQFALYVLALFLIKDKDKLEKKIPS